MIDDPNAPRYGPEAIEVLRGLEPTPKRSSVLIGGDDPRFNDQPTYLKRIPATIPRARVLVHNHVRPTRRLGQRGFRAWLAWPSAALELCSCGWAPELPAHYRVRRVDWSQCPDVESVPGRCSGAWVVKDSRVIVESCIIGNAEAGASAEEIADWFEVPGGVDVVKRILAFAGFPSPETRTGADLIAALQSSPYREIDIDVPERRAEGIATEPREPMTDEPRMDYEITEAYAHSDHTVTVTWSDGARAEISFAPFLEKGGVFEALKDPDYFVREMRVLRDGVGVTWPNGADFSADGLRQDAQAISYPTLYGEEWITALLLAMVIDHCHSYSPEALRTMTSYFNTHDTSPDRHDWLKSYNIRDNADAMIYLHESGYIEITEQEGAHIRAKVLPKGRTLIDSLRAQQKRDRERGAKP